MLKEPPALSKLPRWAKEDQSFAAVVSHDCGRRGPAAPDLAAWLLTLLALGAGLWLHARLPFHVNASGL